jgi:hypothetical protein
MSASSTTACGDTSEGSTAAKLEVASPKSPTVERRKSSSLSQKSLEWLEHVLHTLAIALRI